MKLYEPGETLVLQGEPGDVAFLILSGRVNVTVVVENGAESLLAIRHPGDIVGERAVLNDEARMATVTARIRTSVLVIPGRRFKDFLGEHPGAAIALASMANFRLKQSNTYRADAMGYAVNARLARTVLYQAELFAKKVDGEFRLDLLQVELGMLIGAQEGTVQKAFKGDALRDLVVSRRGRIFIRDVVGLAEIADIPPPARLLAAG
ncbi:Crp/Fnr family transcriptional regulator [Actinocorallia longicatena]